MSVIAGTRVSVNRADREWPRLGDVRNLVVKGRELAGVSTLLCICIGLIIFASVYALNLAERDPQAVFNDFLTLPLRQQAAWIVIIVSSLCWIAGTIWQSGNLALQGKVIQASERRFHKLREDVDTLSSVSAADLESRIADIRQRQQPLRDRIAAVVEKRQSLDEVFMDLNHRQYLIERALSDTEKKAHSDELETRILRLADFIKTAQSRFDEIDRLAARLTELKSEFGDLELRLTPLQSNRGLLENLATELDALRDRLFVDIDHLEQNGDRSLAGWVEDFAAAKQELQERVSRVSEEFAKLDVVRNDIGGLLANLRDSLKVKVSA